ncbi:DUF4198 domain-containing protein [Candidatus Marinarcus aquaticus]|uniref:DUF4198 domain-containing protein n=1 Tax=Candidatus Marinarcus aquaticus TaxID=2044504 RepID=A0A4V1LNX6_9BACT|nr:DUF4198 domain-containing protein [Candidatus Marinarcus aquaticus]RXJ57550.1 hypothetical protein CRV04_06990 [Candidatus Marinarcus aquaticus]
MNISKIIVAGTLTASSLFAHSLWVNSFNSTTPKGGHTTVSIGWGHHLSIDDSVPTKMKLNSFNLIDPSNQAIALEMPLEKVEEIYKDAQLAISKSNMAMQKISFQEKALKGTYSVALATKTGYFTKYIDIKGKERFKRLSKDKITDAKKILQSNQINTFAKSYFVFNQWSAPKPVGHPIELIPTNDFTTINQSEGVTFDVLLEGKPLSSGYVTAKSALNPRANALFAPVKKGKASFVVPHKGVWIFNVTHKTESDITHIQKTSATLNIQ